jgi:general secretion pathway protein C
MEALFSRYFWIVKTLGIAAAAGLAASAVSTQIGSSFVLAEADADGKSGGDTDGEDADEDEKADALDAKAAKPSATPKVGSTRASKDRASTQVRKFNVFCPSCQPAEPEGPVSAGGPTTPTYDADGRPIGPVIKPGEIKSSLPLRLQATMESEDPELSLATVYDADTGSVGLFGMDDVVRPGVVVTGIDQGVVHLRNQAQLEYLEVGGAIPEPSAAPPPEEKKADAKEDAPKDDRAIAGAEDAINCPNENLCTVERAFVESLLANPMQLAKQARIVPARDGETGFKFYGIRRGSLPKLIGLKNGDKLVAVNGEDLTGIDQAMGLYTKLRRASNLQVTIERKGKTINKEIQIQ